MAFAELTRGQPREVTLEVWRDVIYRLSKKLERLRPLMEAEVDTG